MAVESGSPRPIGVYDSGVGGVSVLRALRSALPHESFVYVADSGHAPYGDRAPSFVTGRAHRVADFLARQRAKALVLACNTASVAAAASLRAAHDLPIVAMEPAIKPAALATRSRTILVLATTNTIASAAVARLCDRFGQGVRVILQACPGLAEQVERGELASPATRELLGTYLRPGLDAGADTVVLGCTHYPFLAAQIAQIAGPGVAIVEPSAAIARQLALRLDEVAPPAGGVARPTVFYTSGSTARLQDFLSLVGEPSSRIDVLPDAG